MKLVAPIISYTLDQPTLDWCKRLALRRSGSMGHRDTVNSKNMMLAKPPWHRHYVGAIGELAYAWFSEQKVDIATIGRGDNGSDFPDGVQVKSSDVAGRPPRLMVLASQWKRKNEQTYVLAWVRWDTKSVSLMGWISRDQFELIHTPGDNGYGATMWVDHRELHPMETLKYELHH